MLPCSCLGEDTGLSRLSHGQQLRLRRRRLCVASAAAGATRLSHLACSTFRRYTRSLHRHTVRGQGNERRTDRNVSGRSRRDVQVAPDLGRRRRVRCPTCPCRYPPTTIHQPQSRMLYRTLTSISAHHLLNSKATSGLCHAMRERAMLTEDNELVNVALRLCLRRPDICSTPPSCHSHTGMATPTPNVPRRQGLSTR